ncbi:hypothetical protein E2C01_100368 [Portunus trituberculatus]|uniref:Uncharacterized protein n=1 Tax=Portunus trituberculatus TaxID=210409 RepID=A0A5B7KHT4_PORTR|nr:hypothetical protein [Portunus trituberculatus]
MGARKRALQNTGRRTREGVIHHILHWKGEERQGRVQGTSRSWRRIDDNRNEGTTNEKDQKWDE